LRDAEQGDAVNAMSYALASSPTGAVHQAVERPLLKSTKHVVGPGGGSVVTGPHDRDWLVYHGREAAGSARTLRVDARLERPHHATQRHGPRTQHVAAADPVTSSRTHRALQR